MQRTNQRWTRWGTGQAAAGSDRSVVAEGPVLAVEKPTLPGLQKRTFARAASVETRSAGMAGRVVRGYVPFNLPIETADEFVELIKPGAFSMSLSVDDPRALWNLNPECVLGRKSSMTASFWEDSAALRFEVDVPGTSWGDDMLVSIRRGDVDSVALVFYTMAYTWSTGADGRRVCNVTRAKLLAASIVSFDGFATVQADAEQALARARAAGHAAGLAEGRAIAGARPRRKLLASLLNGGLR